MVWIVDKKWSIENWQLQLQLRHAFWFQKFILYKNAPDIWWVNWCICIDAFVATTICDNWSKFGTSWWFGKSQEIWMNFCGWNLKLNIFYDELHEWMKFHKIASKKVHSWKIHIWYFMVVNPLKSGWILMHEINWWLEVYFVDNLKF